MQNLSKYTKKSSIELPTRYLTFISVGSVVLVGIVFCLGVLLGSRHRGVAACPKPDPLAALDLISGEPPVPASSPEVKLSFHESLTENQDAVPTPASLLEEKPAVKRSSGDETNNELILKDKTDEILEKPRYNEPDVPEEISGKEPGVYSLQVGSFNDQREATRMVRKLQRAGHESFLVSVDMPDRGGVWYRVRVGPFESKQKAWLYKKLFEDKERLPAFVVKNQRSG